MRLQVGTEFSKSGATWVKIFWLLSFIMMMQGPFEILLLLHSTANPNW